jgi:hypothetical protein
MRTPKLELVVCPECGSVAEVADRVTLASTSGPVATVKIRCLRRHTFVLAADRLDRLDV